MFAKSIVTFAMAGMALTAGPAVADASVSEGGSQYAIGLTGFVPVVCRASFAAAPVIETGTTVSLGSLSEFCNSPGGYRVVATYSPTLASGKLRIDGRDIELPESGSVVVSESDSAAITSHDVELALPEGNTGGAMSFRIEPR